MQKPDWGQGISDIIQQIMPFIMMKKFGQQGQPSQSVGQSPINPAAGNRPMPSSVGSMMPPQNGNYGAGMAEPGNSPFAELPPDLLQRIMAIFQTMKTRPTGM